MFVFLSIKLNSTTKNSCFTFLSLGKLLNHCICVVLRSFKSVRSSYFRYISSKSIHIRREPQSSLSCLSFSDAVCSFWEDASLRLGFLLQSCFVLDRGRWAPLGPVRDPGTLPALPERPGGNGFQGAHTSCWEDPPQVEQPHCHIQEGQRPQPGDGTRQNVLGVLWCKSEKKKNPWSLAGSDSTVDSLCQ